MGTASGQLLAERAAAEEGAFGAKGGLAAEAFTVFDNQGVIFIEQVGIGGEVLHEQRPDRLVGLRPRAAAAGG